MEHAKALVTSKIIPESMSLAGANALQKAYRAPDGRRLDGL